MDKPPRGLDGEDIPHVSSNLKKFPFPLLYRDLMFSNDSHIFPVMASIDVIRPPFDEVELPPCFHAHEFRCSRRVLDGTMVSSGFTAWRETEISLTDEAMNPLS